MENITAQLLEFFFFLTGLLMAYTSVRVAMDEKHPARFGTFFFWFLLAITFSFGPLLPAEVNGGLVMVMGVLTLFKQVKIGPPQCGL